MIKNFCGKFCIVHISEFFLFHLRGIDVELCTCISLFFYRGIEVGVEKEVRPHHTGNRLRIKHSQMTVVNHKMIEISDGYEGTGCHPPEGVDQKEITNVGFLVRDPLGDLRGEITKIEYHYENVSNRKNITVMKKGT